MVSLANSIAPGDIPPQVRIRVIDETPGVAGRDYFGDGLSEQLFDTPGAVARIWRSRAHTRTFTVSAEATQDPNDRPLAFHWRVLQGDPARVRITPLDAGRRARIEIDWCLRAMACMTALRPCSVSIFRLRKRAAMCAEPTDGRALLQLTTPHDLGPTQTRCSFPE
jgi:hypothetical protein